MTKKYSRKDIEEQRIEKRLEKIKSLNLEETTNFSNQIEGEYLRLIKRDLSFVSKNYLAKKISSFVLIENMLNKWSKIDKTSPDYQRAHERVRVIKNKLYNEYQTRN
jgi:hypothetical protein